MLSPNERLLYLSQLTPPLGYRLDRALATTFTLDLLALLAAPVSMAGLEVGSSDAGDPVVLLESLRRAADRFVVFSQQGRISVPKRATPLFGLLEKAVVEVRSPAKQSVFHPKVWVLRYVSETNPVMYRVLCLSRNLTFDHSWDTLLCLEGELKDRQLGFGVNRPLVDFVRALLDLAVGDLGQAALETAEQIAGEIDRVQFDCPEGFDPEYGFIPLGIAGYRKWELGEFSRAMIVSPFLTEEGVRPLTEQGRNNVLISRLDQLDALPEETVAALRKRGSIFTMFDSAAWPDPDMNDEAEVASQTSGLHAKLYVLENGHKVAYLTGSLNATSAALHRNVEFMTWLSASKYRFGIDQILGKLEDKLALRALLLPYTRENRVIESAATEVKLEEALQAIAQELMAVRPYAEVITENDQYGMVVKGHPDFSARPEAVVKCHPVTLPVSNAQRLAIVDGQGPMFKAISTANLTTFWAFTISMSGQTLSFALNLPVTNMPDDRGKHILRAVIDDRDKFVRYLMFMLADDPDSLPTFLRDYRSDIGSGRTGASFSLPLLEELIRGASRSPERLLGLREVVDELMKTEEGRQVLPEGFDKVWPAILTVCESAAGGRE